METQNSEMTQMPTAKGDASQQPRTAAEIQEWLVSYLAELLGIKADEIDIKNSFELYGLDSSAAVGLTGDLEDWLGCELDPTLLYAYPTIEGFVGYLAEKTQAPIEHPLGTDAGRQGDFSGGNQPDLI